MENKTTDRLSTAEKREFVTLLRDVSAYINPTRFTDNEKNAFLKMVYHSMHEDSPAHDPKGLPIAIMTLRWALLFAEASLTITYFLPSDCIPCSHTGIPT